MSYSPFNVQDLQVDRIHSLKIKQFGNPKGKPIVLLHGGPGSGKNESLLKLFDLNLWHVILYDQRGAGESRPSGELENNTTNHLVTDLEKIRNHLGLNMITLIGGSWGSTLALAYAIKYCENVESLILRGIFLGRKQDIDWFYGQNAHRTNPERWQHYDSLIAKGVDDYVRYYYDQILSGSHEHCLAWTRLEAMNLGDHVAKEQVNHFMSEDLAKTLARIESHYFVNACFFPSDNYLLENCHLLKDINISIIHGSNDMVCNVSQAYELSEKLPHSKLIILENAGHAALDPQIHEAELAEIRNHF